MAVCKCTCIAFAMHLLCTCRTLIRYFNGLCQFTINSMVSPVVVKKRPQKVARLRPLARSEPTNSGDNALIVGKAALYPIVHYQVKICTTLGSRQVLRIGNVISNIKRHPGALHGRSRDAKWA